MKTWIVIAILLFAMPVMAGQRYNAMEDRWETTPNNWDMRYNPLENEWSYQPNDAEIEYNPFEDSWDWSYE